MLCGGLCVRCCWWRATWVWDWIEEGSRQEKECRFTGESTLVVTLRPSYVPLVWLAFGASRERVTITLLRRDIRWG